MNVGPSTANGESGAQLAGRTVGERLVDHVPLRDLPLPVTDDVLDVPGHRGAQRIGLEALRPRTPAANARPACGRACGCRFRPRTRPAGRRRRSRSGPAAARSIPTSSRFRASANRTRARPAPGPSRSTRRALISAVPIRRCAAAPTCRSGRSVGRGNQVAAHRARPRPRPVSWMMQPATASAPRAVAPSKTKGSWLASPEARMDRSAEARTRTRFSAAVPSSRSRASGAA